MHFTKKILNNGITVLHEHRDIPIVSLSITNRFGSKHETSLIKGIAHFMEHLVFTGTKTRTHEDISREIEKRGGILNAFTNESVTSFWFKLPAEHTEFGLNILIDILKNATFEEKKFEKEKKVILEEIKMYHDAPQYHIYEKILLDLYEPPFGEGVAGSKETVSALTREFVFDYFTKNYNPSGYIVSIVGNADLDKICKILEEEFEPSAFIPSKLEIKKRNSHSIEERKGIDQAHYIFGMHAPTEKKKRYAFELLDAYLANGMSSKLFLTIREDKGLAYSVRSTADIKEDYSYYTIYVGTTKEAIPEVQRLILEGFESVQNLTEPQLQDLKTRLIGLWKICQEDSTSVMTSLMFEELTSNAEQYYEYEKNINAVNLEDLKSLAKIEKFSTSAIVPA